MHDDRGNASMEWERFPDARAPRVPLSIEEDEQADATRLKTTSRVPGGAFEPYGREAVKKVPGMTSNQPPPRKPKDLRKLGEWLKLMRELEERKKRGEE